MVSVEWYWMLCNVNTVVFKLIPVPCPANQPIALEGNTWVFAMLTASGGSVGAAISESNDVGGARCARITYLIQIPCEWCEFELTNAGRSWPPWMDRVCTREASLHIFVNVFVSRVIITKRRWVLTKDFPAGSLLCILIAQARCWCLCTGSGCVRKHPWGVLDVLGGACTRREWWRCI